MKKTVNINLNGIVFHIDEDAYSTLQNYLNELSLHFDQEEGQEIMTDIEARIAELFTDKLKGQKTVITQVDVDDIISILGHPNEFDTEQENEPANSEQDERQERKRRKKYRRFFRDPDNLIIGGVCSGLAAYLNWDVTLIRIIFMVLLFVGFGWIIPIYLLLWVLTPEAKTAAQRLEMRGEEPTLENIKNYVESDRFKDSATRIGSRIADVLRWILKYCFLTIGIIITFVSIIVLISIIIGLVAFVFIGAETGYMDNMLYISSVVFVISLCLVVSIPIIALIIGSWRLIRNSKKPYSKTANWVLLTTWIIALIAFIFTAIYNGSNYNMFKEVIGITKMIDQEVLPCTEVREAEAFNSIEAAGVMNVIFTQSDDYSLIIEAPEDVISNIESEVKNGVLQLKYNKLLSPGKINIALSGKEINSIVAKKGAVVKNEGTLKCNTLNLTCRSAACIDLDVTANHIVINNDNASYVVLAGEVKKLSLSCSNASNNDLQKLQITHADIDANNASVVKLGYVNTLSINASNASNITYDSVRVQKKAVIKNGANLSVK